MPVATSAFNLTNVTRHAPIMQLYSLAAIRLTDGIRKGKIFNGRRLK